MFIRKITICSDTYGQLASKWHRKHHVQEAKQHTDKAFYLSLYSYCSYSDWSLMRTRVCFQNATKKLCPANGILAGKEVLGRTRSAVWLSSERGRTAGVQLGCMDHCWLTLISEKFTVILKINGPSMKNYDLVEFLQPLYSCVKEYL